MGVGPLEMAGIVAERFGFDPGYNRMRAWYKNHHLNSGICTRFTSGHATWNKGLRGYAPEGSDKGWFRQHHEPHNTLPVGTERMGKDGYLIVKTGMPNVWRFKHLIVWEQLHGPVRKGCAIVFLDHNPRNLAPGNLAEVTRKQLAVMNKKYKWSGNAEINLAKLTLARLEIETNAVIRTG